MLKTLYFLFILSCSSYVYAEQNLLSLYEIAEQNDPATSKISYQQNIAQERWLERLGYLLPDLSLSAKTSSEHLNNRKNTFQRKGKQDYYKNTLSLSLTQPIIRWDAWVQLTQADNEIAKTESDFYAAQQALMLRVAEAYFGVLESQEQVKLSQSEKIAIQEQLNQAKDSLAVGLRSKTDVYEAEAAFAKAIAREIEVKNQLSDSKELLKEIIGDIKIELRTLGENIPLIKPSPNNTVKWTTAALQNNVEIIAMINALEISKKEVSVQWGGHLPRIDIVGNYYVADDNSTFGLRGDTASIGVQVSLPLFQGGSTQARIRQAEYQMKISEEELKRVQRSVKKEVRNAYRGVLSTISRVDALKKAVIASEQAVKGTKAAFQAGTRTMVDVLSEQRILYANKVDYSNARYTYLYNSLKLKKWAGSLSTQDLRKIDLL